MAARQSASIVSPRRLPARPNLENLKKLAKTRLKELRRSDPTARLADAQLALAREHGFGSWRTLRRQVQTAALINATSAGDLTLVKTLLDQGHSLAIRDQFGNTPLGWVRGNKMIPILKLLLERGADPNAPSYHEHSPLALYAYESEPQAVKLLLEHGADPNQSRPSTGETALHLASVKDRPGRREVARLLLQAGGDPNRRANVGVESDRAHGVRVSGETPLHIAAASGDGELVQLLLDAGADPTIRDANGKTPSDLANEKGDAEVVKVLQTAKRRRSAVRASPQTAMKASKSDWKPIMDAAFAGDVERVRKLLDDGADPNVLSTTNYHHRPLHRAIERKKTSPRNERHEAVVKLLLRRGADPKLRATHGRHTALQLAAIDSPRFVPLLLERFKPLDIWHACVALDEKRVAGLLKKDPSLATKRDENEWTLMHYVAASAMFAAKVQTADAQLSIARMLLDAGADVNATYGYQGRWAIPVLWYACGYHDNPALTELLLQRSANACDNESVYHASDEMHEASLAVIEKHVPKRELARECTQCLRTQMRWGNTRGMKWLLAHGADPNAAGEELGNAALHWAAKNGASAAVIKTLLDHGAEPSLRNKAGQTPLDLARDAGKQRVVQQLISYTAPSRKGA